MPALGRKFKLDWLDQHRQNSLAEQAGCVDLSEAPFGSEPCFGYQDQHGFAAMGRGLERVLPALAGDEPALGIEIEKNILPAIPAWPGPARCSGRNAI